MVMLLRWGDGEAPEVRAAASLSHPLSSTTATRPPPASQICVRLGRWRPWVFARRVARRRSPLGPRSLGSQRLSPRVFVCRRSSIRSFPDGIPVRSQVYRNRNQKYSLTFQSTIILGDLFEKSFCIGSHAAYRIDRAPRAVEESGAKGGSRSPQRS